MEVSTYPDKNDPEGRPGYWCKPPQGKCNWRVTPDGELWQSSGRKFPAKAAPVRAPSSPAKAKTQALQGGDTKDRHIFASVAWKAVVERHPKMERGQLEEESKADYDWLWRLSRRNPPPPNEVPF